MYVLICLKLINYRGNLLWKRKRGDKFLSSSPLKPLVVLQNTLTERWKRLEKEFPFHPIGHEPFIVLGGSAVTKGWHVARVLIYRALVTEGFTFAWWSPSHHTNQSFVHFQLCLLWTFEPSVYAEESGFKPQKWHAKF